MSKLCFLLTLPSLATGGQPNDTCENLRCDLLVLLALGLAIAGVGRGETTNVNPPPAFGGKGRLCKKERVFPCERGVLALPVGQTPRTSSTSKG